MNLLNMQGFDPKVFVWQKTSTQKGTPMLNCSIYPNNLLTTCILYFNELTVSVLN